MLPPAKRAAWRPGRDALAARLDADQPDVRVLEEAVEDPHRVAAAADARDDDVRQAADLIEHLPPRLAADDRLELAHHQRIRMRPERRAEQVIGVGDVGDPVAHRFVDRVLERPAAGVDLPHLGAEQAHPDDVQRLPPHVLGAHVDAALEPEQRAGGRGRHAVLAGAGLGDDAPLAHAPGEQRLPHRVVDLVRAGVREVFALEENPDTPAVAGRLGRQPPRLVQRRRAPDVVLAAGRSSSSRNAASARAAR